MIYRRKLQIDFWDFQDFQDFFFDFSRICNPENPPFPPCIAAIRQKKSGVEKSEQNHKSDSKKERNKVVKSP